MSQFEGRTCSDCLGERGEQRRRRRLFGGVSWLAKHPEQRSDVGNAFAGICTEFPTRKQVLDLLLGNEMVEHTI
jgi:hypothetical protein